ncbi:MAG: sensor domain-containing diguanylate cyclase, partial [Candidatus Omnitrophica bacterium]|nr:sensor domain-containing diguanylate cyclase [Candidatus Omnitrophota bacterium]
TILEGMPFEITTNEARKLVNHDEIENKLKTEFFVTIPLKSKDKVLGAILVDNLFTKKPITKSDIRVLTMFANHAGLAIENSKLYEKTLLLAKVDWLSKLWNSGEFHKKLAFCLEKAKMNDSPLSLAMIDMDNFKLYNDTFGHLKGDEAIKDIAKTLSDKSRKNDTVARYGGEEFALIMPSTDKENARLLAERLRAEIETFFIEKQGIQSTPRMTASIGIATFPQDADEKDFLINRADSALYEAKRTGKNKVCIYRSDLKKLIERFTGTPAQPG